MTTLPIHDRAEAADRLLDARKSLTEVQWSTLPGLPLYEAMARSVRAIDDGLAVLDAQGSAARGATASSASAVPSGQSTPASASTASARPAGGPLLLTPSQAHAASRCASLTHGPRPTEARP